MGRYYQQLVLICGGMLACAVPSAEVLAAGTLSQECATVLHEGVGTRFTSRAEQVARDNLYLGCWGENAAMQGSTALRNNIGEGLEMFSHTDYIEALSFSRQLCLAARSDNYPCWFESAEAIPDLSMEEAVRRETPKLLFTLPHYGTNGRGSVEYVLCLNDDPTKPKEFTRGCTRGYKMQISEYARSDIDRDGLMDILVNVKFGLNDTYSEKSCFIAGFGRKEGHLLKLITFSPSLLCE